MRKQLSFKKVVQAVSEVQPFLWKNGWKREGLGDVVRIYAPLYLDFIFNKINEYPKSEEVMLKELKERMGIPKDECVHCGSPKRSIAGLARDGRGKLMRCPFHE